MRKIFALLLLLPLAACDDDEKPKVSVSSDNICEQSTDVMVRMAQACATGGGKYPEDCMKAATSHFCPEVNVYRVNLGDQWGAWTPCTKAKSSAAKSACATFDQ